MLNEDFANKYNQFCNDKKMPLSYFNDEEENVSNIIDRFDTIFSYNNKIKTVQIEDEVQSIFHLATKPNTNFYKLYDIFTEPSHNIVSDYDGLKKSLSKAFKVNIIEKQLAQKFVYKKEGFIKKTLLFVPRLAMRISKKYRENDKNTFKSTIKINNYDMINGRDYTPAEKIVKLYNIVCEKTCDKLCKKNSDLVVKKLSSLIATQYVAMGANIGSANINRNIYASLSLQISNVLASAKSLTSEQKEQIKQNSAKTVEIVLGKLGKTKNDVLNNMKSINFALAATEDNEYEEIMFANCATKYEPIKTASEKSLEIDNSKNHESDANINKNIDKPDKTLETPKTEKSKDPTPIKTKLFSSAIDRKVEKTLSELLETKNQEVNALRAEINNCTDEKQKTSLTKKYKTAQQNQTFIQTLKEKYTTFAKSNMAKDITLDKIKSKDTKVLTSDDYATKFAEFLVRKKNDIMRIYFDENTVKSKYAKLSKNDIFNEYLKAVSPDKTNTQTFKTVIKNYAKKIMKLSVKKIDNIENPKNKKKRAKEAKEQTN